MGGGEEREGGYAQYSRQDFPVKSGVENIFKNKKAMRRRESSSGMISMCVIPIVIVIVIGVAGLTFVFLGWGRNSDQKDTLEGLEKLILKIKKDTEEQFDIINEEISMLTELDEDVIDCIEGICGDFPEGLKAFNLIGCWDAGTNIPNITSGEGNNNDAYIVCANGTVAVDGQDDWERGDWLVFIESEGAWIKNDGSPTANFRGCWDADANVPPIVSSAGNDGDAFVVCVNGSTAIDGEDDWERGDFLIFAESEGVWIKNDGSPEEIVLPNITIPDNSTGLRTWTPIYDITSDLDSITPQIAFFSLLDNGDIYIEVSFLAKPALSNPATFNLSGFPLDPVGLPTAIYWTELTPTNQFVDREKILTFDTFLAPDVWNVTIDILNENTESQLHLVHFKVAYTPVGSLPVLFLTNDTFVVPPCVTTMQATVQGGGGGGGAGGRPVFPASFGGGGAGGGAGGETIVVFFATTPGETLTIVVGPGGAGGAALANGVAGGGSSVSSTAIFLGVQGGGGGFTATGPLSTAVDGGAGGSGGFGGGGGGGDVVAGSGGVGTNTSGADGVSGVGPGGIGAPGNSASPSENGGLGGIVTGGIASGGGGGGCPQLFLPGGETDSGGDGGAGAVALFGTGSPGSIATRLGAGGGGGGGGSMPNAPGGVGGDGLSGYVLLTA